MNEFPAQQIKGERAGGVPGTGENNAGSFHKSYNYTHRLRQELKNSNTRCWLLVTIAALAGWNVGSALIQVLFMVFPMLGVLLETIGLPAWIMQPVEETLILSAVGSNFFAPIVSAGIPALLIAGTLMVYKRAHRECIRDLVWGNMGYMMANEQFAIQIEAARQERYQPSINVVSPDGSLSGNLRHFLHYYPLYYRLSFGPEELRVPRLVGTNCWFDGVILWLSCNVWCLPVTIWFLIRTALYWPRMLGQNRAIVEYLEGRFDRSLEDPRIKPF